MNAKKRIIKIVLILLALCLTVGIISIVSYSYVQTTGEKQLTYLEYTDDLKKVDYVLIPGAGIIDGAPSPIMEAHLKRGVQLYALGLTDQLVLSGVHSEVVAMQKYITLFDIPKSKIWIDEYGVDTYNSIKRADEFFQNGKMYFCTLPQYSGRAGFIINSMDIDGKVIGSSSIIRKRTLKSYAREYFAATKAVFEATILKKNPEYSIKEKPIESATNVTIPSISNQIVKYDPNLLLNEISKASEMGLEISTTSPKKIAYNTVAAIKYARNYSNKRNPDYPEYERNCTNFVSQCLVAGGMPMIGQISSSLSQKLHYDKNPRSWYCTSQFADKQSQTPPNYKLSTSFIRNEDFIEYWTTIMDKELFIVANSFAGRSDLRTIAKEGDIFILYDKNEDISHIGLITNVSDEDALYCSNTSDRKDFSTSGLNDSVYPKFGIISL